MEYIVNICNDEFHRQESMGGNSTLFPGTRLKSAANDVPCVE